MKKLIFIMLIIANVWTLLAITKEVIDNESQLIIEVTNNDFKISDEGDFLSITAPNTSSGGQAGQANIPYYVMQLSTPENFTPQVSINVLESKTISLSKAIQPIPDVVKGKSTNRYIYQLKEDKYREKLPQIQISPNQNFRSISFTEIRFNPFQYNYDNKTLEIITKAELITWIPKSKTKGKQLDRLENDFVTGLIQPEEYHVAKVKYRDINFSDFSVANHWYKIEVDQDGIQALTYNKLQDLLPVDDIDPRNFRIFTTGGQKMYEKEADAGNPFREIPLLIEGEADGSFDNNDRIIFYARDRNDYDYLSKLSDFMAINPYSDKGIYWLTFDAVLSSLPLRMDYETDLTSPNITRSNNPQSSRYEREFYKRLQTNLYWYSNFLTGSSTTTNSFDLSVSDLDPSDNNANSRVKAVLIEEYNGSSYSSKRHEAYLSLNNLKVSDNNVWYGYTYKEIIGQANNLTNGNNSVSVTIERNRSDNLYLDYIEIQYIMKNIKHSGKQLGINFRDEDLGQTIRYSVEGSFSSNTRIFSTNDIYDVKMLNYSLQGNSLRFNGFTPFSNLNKSEYYVPKFYVTNNDYLTPNIEAVEPVDIISQSLNKESIIIYPNDFSEQALRLKAIYENIYNSPTVALNLTDIFNQFSGGMDDPTAIRNFLSHLYSLEVGKNLHYVTLLGIGTYDWKNYKAFSADKNQMIIYQQGNSSTNDAVTSDDYFAYLTQNRFPELAIGRYPAKNQNELNMMLDKFEVYSNKDFTIDWWRNTGLFVADDLKNGTATNETSHTVQLNQAIDNAPPSLINERIYAYLYEPDEFGKKPNARKDFIDAINQGALLTYYSGHGSYDQLGTEAYFRQGIDTPLLTNDLKRTFFISAACDVSQFDSPDFDCLSSDLLKYDAGGAIATYGSTRLCYIPNNNIMVGNLLYFALDNRHDIGTAIMLSKTRETSSDSNTINQSKYILFGDPHLEITPPESRNNIVFENNTNSFKARETVKFSGELASTNIQLAKILAFQSDTFTSLGGRDILLPGNYIFNGQTSLTNGLYSSAFVVPDDITDGELGKILVYGIDESSNQEFLDYYYPVEFAGQSSNIVNDSPPEISLWLESYDFREGDVVSQNPLLLVEISDENGINVSGGSGHQLLLMIDNDFNSYDITPFFKYDIDSYQSGKLEYLINDLNPGNHILKILAFDNLNQPSVKTTSFKVSDSSEISISNILPYPNPMPKSGGDFTFMLSSDAEINIDIYTFTGKKINSLKSFATKGFNTVRWNGRDKSGDQLANNTYFYIIKATAEGKSVSKREKFIILD